MNWRPIETAPKDGTEILAYAQTPYMGIEIVRWHEGDNAWIHGDFDHVMNATHWMPLPPPPSTEPAPQDTGEWNVVNEYGEHNLYRGNEYVGEVRFEEQGQEICASMNLLAGHELSQVVVLDKKVVEEVKGSLNAGIQAAMHCTLNATYHMRVMNEAIINLEKAQALASLNTGGEE